MKNDYLAFKEAHEPINNATFTQKKDLILKITINGNNKVYLLSKEIFIILRKYAHESKMLMLRQTSFVMI